MNSRHLLKAVIAAVVCVFVVGLIDDAIARGGGGGRGGGGFSRSSPAAGGSFSGRTAQRPTSSWPSTMQRQPGGTGTRQSPGTMQSQRAQQNRPTERPQQRPDGSTGNREDWQQHREDMQGSRQEQLDQAREDRQDFYKDEIDDDWDNDWGDDDWDAGEVAAVVVGTAIVAAAVYDPTPVYVLPCNVTAVTVGGVYYYPCGSVWYTQTYTGGGVVYVQTAPPPGY